MHTIVDGYNVIMVQPGCHRRLTPNEIRKARETFLELLGRYQMQKGGRFTVVFDAGSSKRSGPETGAHAGLEIVFAAPPSDADSVIKELVEKSNNPSDVRVATSDRAVRAYVKRVGAKLMTATAFLKEVAGGAGSQRDTEPREKEVGLRDEQVDGWLRVFGFRRQGK